MEKRILFCCTMNAIRSPMASNIFNKLTGDDNTYHVLSAGVEEGILDGFVISVMREYGVDLMKHAPCSLANVTMHPWEVIIVFCPVAYSAVQGIASRTGVKVELWEVRDPSTFEGNREQKLQEYRTVRDIIERKIKERFKV